MNDLLARVEAIVGPDGFLTGEEVHDRAAGFWREEPVRARALVRPRTTEQLAQVLVLCNEAGQTVVTHGGLTGLVQGADSTVEDIVISVELMNEIEEVDTANRTMTVQSGCRLQAIQEAAGDAGMQFTLDLGARGSCTIGGNVATNAGGNRVIRYGMTRDLVLGLEAVLADGTVVSSMNSMIKNNAGYDLKQLFIGTEGTLGVITRLVLRLREKPRSECTALVATDSLDKVVRLLKHVDSGLGGNLSSFEVMWQDFYRLVTTPPARNRPPLPQDCEYYVLIESLGSHQDRDQAQFEQVLGEALERDIIADAVIASSGKERASLWALRDDVGESHQYGPVISFDVSLRIAEMEEYVAAVRQRLEQDWDGLHCWVFGHLGDGNLHLAVAVGDDGPATRERVEAAVYTPLQAIGGSVSAEHGIGLEKKHWLRFSRSAEEIGVMRRLKRALDPAGILNPGKIFDLE